MYVAKSCTKPVSLYSDQKGLRMIKVGPQGFLNQQELLPPLILRLEGSSVQGKK